jgi:ubiquitin carboxyl-terminal hydrolase 5/13
VEQNLKFDFAMTGADGKSLEPLFGPHLTGLRNLGNSCYMASTLQSLFALPAFQERYYAAGESALSQHAQTCPKSPADCIECQMLKMADGLLSGRYSVPSARPSHHQISTSPSLTDTRDEPQDEAIFQDGIKPAMFKALIGKDHEEFKTMRQQDADEFLKHLIKTVDRAAPGGRADAVTAGFKFAMETRLQCTECKGVRYRTEELDSLSVPVPIVEKGMQVDGAPVEKKEYKEVRIERCLEMLTGETELEYRCPSCKKQVTANQCAP